MTKRSIRVEVEPAIWESLARRVGVSPETMTAEQARQAVYQLIYADQPRERPIIATSARPTGHQLVASYYMADDPEGWLDKRKKYELQHMARALNLTDRDTDPARGQYWTRHQLRKMIYSVPRPAALYAAQVQKFYRDVPDGDSHWDRDPKLARRWPSIQAVREARQAMVSPLADDVYPVWLVDQVTP